MPTWPCPSSGDLNFDLLRDALTNGLEQAWRMTNGQLHGSFDNLAVLLLHYFLCRTPNLVLTHVSLARCTVSIWSCHCREVKALWSVRIMVHGTVGIRNLLDIPHSAAFWLHAPSTTTRALNIVCCPHGALTSSALKVKSQVKLTLRRGCPAWAVEAGCLFEGRETRAGPQPCWADLVFGMKNILEKHFRCFWLVVPFFPLLSLFSW